MSNNILKIHPSDNVLVALVDLKAGDKVTYQGNSLVLANDVPAKHKFADKELKPADDVIMYGILVGKAILLIPKGGVIGTHNIKHQAAPYSGKTKSHQWSPPESPN